MLGGLHRAAWCIERTPHPHPLDPPMPTLNSPAAFVHSPLVALLPLASASPCAQRLPSAREKPEREPIRDCELQKLSSFQVSYIQSITVLMDTLFLPFFSCLLPDQKFLRAHPSHPNFNPTPKKKMQANLRLKHGARPQNKTASLVRVILPYSTHMTSNEAPGSCPPYVIGSFSNANLHWHSQIQS